jgi:CDP-glucose 4,6-dehydratase
MIFDDFYRGKRVWVSGGTGFKGSWLCEWLLRLGAEVVVFSLPPPTEPSLFDQLNLAGRIPWTEADIRDAKHVSSSLLKTAPDLVFHLAAQPLVRHSYNDPVTTYETNVLGTIHILEAMRNLQHPCAAVMVTTDKCYENREWLQGYREDDPLGGRDPYSSSKAACEIAIASWRRSFYQNHPVKIASARAGNVIGGGDWAADRIVPDCIRALQSGNPIPVRNRTATRPWQHVLEPLGGYLTLAALLQTSPNPEPLCSAFNFGPGLGSNRTVRELVEQTTRHWPGRWIEKSHSEAPHEAGKLNLSTDKAFHLLGWQPRWNFEAAVEKTVTWYRATFDGEDAVKLTGGQIDDYLKTCPAKT